MNLTEKGGVALHFFASDRSRRNYIDALPGTVCFCMLQLSSHRSGEKHGVRWGGWVAYEQAGDHPAEYGGPGSLVYRNTSKCDPSSPEKRRERPRPVAWPQDPPGQYQPPLCLA